MGGQEVMTEVSETGRRGVSGRGCAVALRGNAAQSPGR